MMIWKKTKADAVGTDEIEHTENAVLEAPASKINIAKELLCRSEGASLKDLTDATGWLPHTMRAALTGLRKKGHAITRFSIEGTSHWRITGTSPAREASGNDDDTSGSGNIASPDASAEGISA